MKLSHIADVLSAYEGCEMRELWNVLRAPGFKAFLTGQPGRGPTGPGRYHPRELIRARLLLAARRAGLDLAEMNNALNRPASLYGERPASALITGGGMLNLSGLNSIIRGAEAGETWLLRVRFNVTGQRDQQTTVVYSPDPAKHIEDLSGSTLADAVSGRNPNIRATLLIDATALVEPLLESYHNFKDLP